jgi:tetratricopeptide (TPR) repeat protein
VKGRMKLSHEWLHALALVVTSCVPSSTARMQYRVDTSRKESDPKVLLARGQAFAGAGDYGRAAQYLRAALLQHGDAAVILPLLVSVEIKDQGYRAAAQHLSERLQAHPSDVRARFVLASLLSALDRPRDAERQLLGILKMAPDHAEATFALGVVYRDGMGDVQRADGYFRRYLAMEPQGRHREEAMSSTLSGVEVSAVEASGVEVSGVPASGMPVSSVPVSGVPVSGMPVSGVQ